MPSGGDWAPEFGMSLTALVKHFYTCGWPVVQGASLTVLNSRGSILPEVRQSLLRNALRVGATHAFWLDDDMVVPNDALVRLLSWDCDFVAAAGAVKDGKGNAAYHPLAGHAIDFSDPGLFEVENVGLACALIKLEPLKKIRPPHFEMPWSDDLKAYGGEDTRFCQVWRENGGQIWVDSKLSLELGHVGKHVYRVSSNAGC